jgi:hypothetical protein
MGALENANMIESTCWFETKTPGSFATLPISELTRYIVSLLFTFTEEQLSWSNKTKRQKPGLHGLFETPIYLASLSP